VITPTVLIVEDDYALRHLLSMDARARGYKVLLAGTLADAIRMASEEPFELAVVDLALGSDSGLDVIRAIRLQCPDTEIVVISATASLASAIASYELDAFAFVPKPFEIDQLFTTVERALDHRSVVLANRRLMWEQRLINEVGDELRHLLAPEQLLERVLRRLMRGMEVDYSAARLLNPESGQYDLVVVSAPGDPREFGRAEPPLAPRPSERVLETRGPVRIADLHKELAGTAASRQLLRSALSVP
jgi:DNA-binding NtrC family response regulator